MKPARLSARMRNFLVTLLLFPLSWNVLAANSFSPASALLNAYSPSCPSTSQRQVRLSLNHIDTMASLVRQMKEDNQCYGAQELFQTLTRYRQVFENYELYRQTTDKQKTTERQVQLYLGLLEANTFEGQRDYLEQEIIQAQTDLISINQRVQRFEGMNNTYAKASHEIAQSISSLFEVWASNPNCFKQGTQLWTTLLSQGLFMASAFASPGTALGLATGAVVVNGINFFTQEFKKNSSAQAINDLKWPTALRCVSESLTETFCDSHKTKQFLSDFTLQGHVRGERLEGIDLLLNHLNRLDLWLREVVAGSPIQSRGDLLNRKTPIDQYNFLAQVRLHLEAFGNIRREFFSSITNGDELTQGIARGITQLVSIMKGPSLNPAHHPAHVHVTHSFDNPIFLIRNEALLIFNLYAPDLRSIPFCGETPSRYHCQDLYTYLIEQGEFLSLDNWEKALSNALSVVDETLFLVGLERARAITVDPFSTLVKAKSDFRGETNAYQALTRVSQNADRIRDYLCSKASPFYGEDCLREEEHPYFPQMTHIQRTKILVEQVKELINEALRPHPMSFDQLPQNCRDNIPSEQLANKSSIHDSREKSFYISSCISTLLHLVERGNSVFFSYIRDMVGFEIEARLKYKDFDDQLDTLIADTRTDLVGALLDSFSTPNQRLSMIEVKTGLETAMGLNHKTMEKFFQHFRAPILTSIENVPTQAEKNDLCFRLLPVIDSLDQRAMKRFYKSCKEAQLRSYEAIGTLKWRDFITVEERPPWIPLFGRPRFRYTFDQSYAQRSCAVRGQNRANRLYEARKLGF